MDTTHSTAAAPRDRIEEHGNWFANPKTGLMTGRSIAKRFEQLGFGAVGAAALSKVFWLRFNTQATNPDGKGIRPNLLKAETHKASTESWDRKDGSVKGEQVLRVLNYLNSEGYLTRRDWVRLVDDNAKRDEASEIMKIGSGQGRLKTQNWASKWVDRIKEAAKDASTDVLGEVTGKLEFALIQRVKRKATGKNDALIDGEDITTFFTNNTKFYNDLVAARKEFEKSKA